MTELTETAAALRGTLALVGSAAAPQPGVADALPGRGRELRLIGAFLDRARGAGEVLVLTTEAGAGKTALLDAAAEMASAAGCRVLRAGGVELEAGLSFSRTRQLLLVAALDGTGDLRVLDGQRGLDDLAAAERAPLVSVGRSARHLAEAGAGPDEDVAEEAACPARRRLVSLIWLCLDDFLTGQWAEGQQLADEGLAICESDGDRFSAWNFIYCQAVVAAARGEDEVSRALADRVTRWAVPRGAHGAELLAHHPRVLSAIGRGDFEDAYRHATAVSPAVTLASHVLHTLWVAFDLVEAAVRTGRHAEANAHVAAMTGAGVAALSPRLALLHNGAAAIAASDSGATGLFERALSVPGAAHWPFDLARVQLAYGERLRRDRATAQSRLQLTAALETFERLGARPWAVRAARELRASGQRNPRAQEQGRYPLTPQEHEIATLAATGLTNKQIGQRLYLSHKTVGNHLFRIFPKLGVASRAALRDALAAVPPRAGTASIVRPAEVSDLAGSPSCLTDAAGGR